MDDLTYILVLHILMHLYWTVVILVVHSLDLVDRKVNLFRLHGID